MTDPDKDLRLSSYEYELPPSLIAERPPENRESARLLVSNGKDISHGRFSDLPSILEKDTLLVFNNSRVFPCRLIGNKESGGAVEIFFLSTRADALGSYPCLMKSSGKKKEGMEILLEEGARVVVLSRNEGEGTFQVTFHADCGLEDYLEKHGLIPIPPYIRDGVSDEQDKRDYQTVFASHVGSVAAPTAGLHFSEELLDELKDKGVEVAHVTLHVGPGTFAPVKSENILEHKMHREEFFIATDEWEKIKTAWDQGKKVIAVGTTSLRVLESCFDDIRKGSFVPDHLFSTDIFLHPGKKIKSIDGLITNFHLPGSTLLMLVSTLVGREKILGLYKDAIDKGYLFYSYGDGMLLMKEELE